MVTYFTHACDPYTNIPITIESFLFDRDDVTWKNSFLTVAPQQPKEPGILRFFTTPPFT